MTSYKQYYNKILGKSQIIELIGSGGMAWVFLAKHTELGINRAIKVLKPIDEDLDSTKKKALVDRFVREARVAASLNHKNIIKIYDVGAFEDTYYIEMEYLKGSTLKDFISSAEGGLPSEVAAMIMYMAADAFYYSHKTTITYEGMEIHGVIHRDIKPENIFVTDTGELKILDFGIAKLSNVSLTTSTEARNVTGTLAYMSPEQIDGNVLGFESDIFSLGTVFYELLTRKNPFFSEQASALVKNITTCNYKPIQSIRPGIHGNFAKVIDSCLKFDPKARFKSALEIRNLAFQILTSHGIINVEEAFRDVITTGNVSSTHFLPVKRGGFPVKKVLFAVLFLGAVIAVHHYVVTPPPLPPESTQAARTPPKTTVAAMFDTNAQTTADTLKNTPQKPPEPSLKASFEAPTAQEKPSSPTPREKVPAGARSKKVSVRPAAPSSPSAVQAQPQAQPPAVPVVMDTLTILTEMIRTLSPGLIEKNITLLPDNDQAYLFFKGYLTYTQNNHLLASSLLENSLRKPTVFKSHRLFFIENALKYKALSYSVLFKSGQKEYQEMAVKSWEGLLRITKNASDISLANGYLKELR